MSNYRPPSAMEIPRFAGIRTFMRLPHVTGLAGVDVAVVGLPFDTGASYRVGARFGPEAIRRGSALLRPYNPHHRINLFEFISAVDYGDLPVVPGFIEDSYRRIEEGLAPVIGAGALPLCLGGDHSVTLAELRALYRRYGRLGVIQVDAHGDTWDNYWGKQYTHGTVFRRAAEEGLLDPDRVIQIGLRGPLYGQEDYEEGRRLGFDLVPMDEVRRLGLSEVIDRARRRAGEGPVFLSFDIDSVDPAFAPGTGTPEVGGFASHEALALLRGLAGVDLVGADVVEVLPAFDVAEITAMLAANVAYEILSLIAVKRRD
ncbi:MAG: agmatinase [Firmicutes bacterium]|nr:agmatinase [Bacillota bacterium]